MSTTQQPQPTFTKPSTTVAAERADLLDTLHQHRELFLRTVERGGLGDPLGPLRDAVVLGSAVRGDRRSTQSAG